MGNAITSLASRKDYFLISFIGLSFGLFSLPILSNINLPFIKLGFTTALAIIVFFVIFANIALWIAAFIGKFIPTIYQLAKFSAVGAFNTFLDWGVLNLLMALTSIAAGLGFSAFKGFSFILATAGSYFWNKYWTFKADKKSTTEEVGKFALIASIGFLINIVLASLIVFTLTPKQLMSPERLANLAAFSATLFSLTWNFLGYKFIVFKK